MEKESQGNGLKKTKEVLQTVKEVATTVTALVAAGTAVYTFADKVSDRSSGKD